MENNEINFTALWHAQKTIQPDRKELQQKITSYRRENLRKKWISNVSLVATVLFILFIGYSLQHMQVTTLIGICLTILAICMSLFKFNKFYKHFDPLADQLSNTEYLEALLTLQVEQKSLQSRFMNLYFILLGSGVALYMWEFTQKMSHLMGIITYGLTFLWIGFVWFYMKPKMIRKQQAHLDGMIQELQNTLQQVKTSE